MISWIVIVVIVVLAIIFLKMNHFRHKMWILLVVLFALFLYGTLYVVSIKSQLDFNSVGGFMGSMKVYGGWLANGFQNLKVLAGNAVKMDWTSTNSSFTESKNTLVETTPSANKLSKPHLAK